MKIKKSGRICIISILLTLLFAAWITACGQIDTSKEQGAAATDNRAEEERAEEKTADVASEEAIIEEPIIEEPNQVSLVMVGDVLLHQPIEDSARLEDGTYNFDFLFEHTKDVISEADIALVNQEVILGGTELGVSGYPAFNAPYEVGDALVEAGFDVVLHGTNHALDRGENGIRNALTFWEENYPQIGVLGIHDSQSDSEEIYVTQINGIDIAILNYTYGTNGISLPADMPYGVDYLEEEKVCQDIEKAQEMADFVIVCPHWGTEYSLEVSSWQQKWTQVFSECGVDLVIGTHPHVIEPIEWITNENGDKMLVYYSLGNYVNATAGQGDGVAARAVGGMAEVTIALDENNEAYISAYGIEGLVSHICEKTTTYFLSDYTQTMAEQNEMCQKDTRFSYEYCVDLCNQVW